LWRIASREEPSADEPGIRKKGVLGPCSEVGGSPLATLNPHFIRVVLQIASVTCTSRDHLRFLNLFEHLFGNLLSQETNPAPKYPR